ncbi:Non-functional NADPH-dependent codeinone reductase 2 [Camellia lanceoleosa]|uniref:Non-functional NADPH-dependent codeinone reductase 2 n=1 Tax=Camellia lanceoleosa TaxID=1840588 RepID=A0ACC0IAG2_9ERIC|nr:Non-functional NADPH-dependent codeinone reductase 2 [Camellia lanceoleosa]
MLAKCTKTAAECRRLLDLDEFNLDLTDWDLDLGFFYQSSNLAVEQRMRFWVVQLWSSPPLVLEVEMNPVWQQKKLREFCEKKGIHVTAYSPLGAKGTRWETNLVMDCEIVKEIAEAKGKTVAQVCLRGVYEQGVSILVKSFNKERIKENLDIFDWMLSPKESKKIDQIPRKKGCLGIEFISRPI